MSQLKSHMFIASASSAAMSLTAMVAAGTMAADTSPSEAVVSVTVPGDATRPSTAVPLQARIIDVSGKARWRASAGSEWKDASVNDDLSPGAEVRTGIRSRVTLRFRNATVLVDSSTNFSIPTIEQDGDVLRTIAAVRSGRADFKVDKVGLENDFKVVTPSTTLAVRGTSFSTITGPLKGVEIVGARENAIRAIEVRYAALNQVVEMSGGTETRSTSETPNPAEHAFGKTFNVPQAGTIASREEAQQVAFTGSSAPQTQRQSTTAVVGVNQLKQDIDAAVRGESGSGSLALLIDISRAAGYRALAQDASVLQASALRDVLSAAELAQARFDAAQSAADGFVAARDLARAALADADSSLRVALQASGLAANEVGSVRESGALALSAFASGVGSASFIGYVASANASAEAALARASEAGSLVAAAGDRIADASVAASPMPSLADQFAAAQHLLELARAAIEGHTTDVESLRNLAAAASAAAQALATGRDVPQLTQSALLAAQAAAEAAQRLLEAGAARDEAEALAALALARAQEIVRDALVQEIESASAALAAASSIVEGTSGAAQQAAHDAALLDTASGALLLAQYGAQAASQAAEDANAASESALGRRVAAQVHADIGRGLHEAVVTQRGIALVEMQNALDALERCTLHAGATAHLVRQVDEALGQYSPDLDAARAAASEALAEAGSADREAQFATVASGRSQAAASAAGLIEESTELAGSETSYMDLLGILSGDVQAADAAKGAAGAAAEAASVGASGAALLADQLEAAFGGSARDAVSAAEQLAQHAASRAEDAQAAFESAQAAYEGALAAGRSAAQVTVWAAVRTLAAHAQADADAAHAAAEEARHLAALALAQAQDADERVAIATAGSLAWAAQQAGAGPSGAVLGVMAAAELAHGRFVELSAAADAFEVQRDEAVAALGMARDALAAAEWEEASAALRAHDVVDKANSAFRAFVDHSDDATILDRQSGAREAGDAATAAAAAMDARLAEAASHGGVAQTASGHLPGLAGQFAQARQAFDQAAALFASADVDVARLRDAAVAAHKAVTALAMARNLPQIQHSLLLAAHAAAEAVQRASDAGRAREEVASHAAEALRRAQGIVHEALVQEIRSAAESVTEVQSRLQAATDAAQRSQDQLAMLDSAIDSMLLARTGAEEAAAAASAADAFRSFAEGRQVAALAKVGVASGVAALVDGHRLAALAQVQAALDALASCRDSALASSAFARAATDALALESQDFGAAGSSAAQAIGSAIMSRRHADDASVAAQVADGAADAAGASVTTESLAAAESLYGQLVGQASSAALGANMAWDAAHIGAIASTAGGTAAALLQSSLVSAFGGGDALAAIAAAERLASDAAARASSAQAAYAAAQSAYEGALAAGRSSAQVTVWDSLRAVALQARQDADAAAAVAAEARQIAGVAIDEARAAGAAVSEAGLSALAQLSYEASGSAHAMERIGSMLEIRSAVDHYAAATLSLKQAVSAAQGARVLGESHVSSLEEALGSADARLESLLANLSAGNRGLAEADSSFISASVAEAGIVAQQVDAARADALLALVGADAAAVAASEALDRLDSGTVSASSHSHALGLLAERAQAAFGAVTAAEEGIAQLAAIAGPGGGAAPGDQALAASAEALRRASAALASISGAGAQVAAALAEAGWVDRSIAAMSESDARDVRGWVESLEDGSSSIPFVMSDRVVAMAGVAQGVIGSYDSRNAATAAAAAAEGARDGAVAWDRTALHALEAHQSAVAGVNHEYSMALGHRSVALGELVVATAFRVDAGNWLLQTVTYVEQADAGQADWAARVTGASAIGAEGAAIRADAAAVAAWDAGIRAGQWASVSASAFTSASDAAMGAEAHGVAAAGFALDAIEARDAAARFTSATEQFAAIAATAAAEDASGLARQMRDGAVAQAVRAESARDAAHAAAASARTRASQVVFGAVAAKAQQTVDTAQQARSFAEGALAQAQAARADANSAVVAASSIAGGTQ